LEPQLIENKHSDNHRSETLDANLLFFNILPANPCGSGFYGEPLDLWASNSFKMNILEISAKKMWREPKQRSKQKGRPKRSALILMVPEAESESRKP
jgi:hypothetical protein